MKNAIGLCFIAKSYCDVALYGLLITGTPLGAVPPVPETLFNGEVEYCTSF